MTIRGLNIKRTLNDTTYYVHDATGNVMGIYVKNDLTLTAQDRPIYGSSRLGIINKDVKSPPSAVRSLPSFFQYRMYDARIGRFWSVDPLKSDYPWNSTYAFAENSVIQLIEILGDRGTIYIQVMLDKKGKPLIDKKTMNEIKMKIEDKGKELNVDWKVKIVYSNAIMSRKQFENRKNSDPSDSYILIGTGKQLDEYVIKNREEKLGWENPSSWPHSVNGTSTDKLMYINIDNVRQYKGESIYESAYSSMVEKLYLTIIHEDGHPKFQGHSQNYNEMGVKTNIGHIAGTIMNSVPKVDKYDPEMIKMLQEIHGKISEGCNKPKSGGHDSMNKNMY